MDAAAESGAGARVGSVTIERRVEWVDTDASGHHHNSAVLRWFEIAEARLLDRLGLLHEIYGHLPRARIEVEFVRSLRFDETVAMEAWIAEIGATSLIYGFELRVEDATAARGSVTVALRSPEAAARLWPADWRRRLREKGLGGAEAAGDGR
jgi:YbgC/YbaW family acyl-CoA thioester hydrolase